MVPASSRRGQLAETLTAHQHWAAAGLLALLVLVYLFPVLVGGRVLLPTTGLYIAAPWAGLAPSDLNSYLNRALGDVVGSYYPWNVLARDLIHAGTFPAWNPHALGGTPFFANPEVAWFSPFSLPLWILPLNWALGFAAALKLWMAGFGTYLLTRELRLGFWAGLLAGVTFALCAFNIVWLSHGVQVSVAVLLPWLLWLTERVVRRGRSVDALALTGVVAFVLTGGHPGTQLHVLSATTLYALMRAAASGNVAARERVRRLGLIGVALVLGALVTAVTLLPAQQAAQDTAGALARREGSVEFAGSWMSSGILRTGLFPDWWGRPSEQIFAGPATYNERTFYAGTLAAVLALVALVSRGGWRRKGPYVVLGIIGAAVAVRAPLVHGFVTGLPLFDRVQNQRMLLWTGLAIAVLSGFGLQALLERPRRWQAWAALGAAGAVVGLVLTTLRYEGEDVSQALHYVLHRSGEASEAALALAGVGWFAIFALALAAILAFAWVRPGARRIVGGLVVLVAALDMLHFANGYQPMAPASIVVPPRTPALAYLQRHAGEGRIGAFENAMFGDSATVYGLRDVRGYDQPQPSVRFFHLWQATQPDQHPGAAFLFNDDTQPTRALLGLLGMRYMLTPPEAQVVDTTTLKPAYRGKDAAIFRNTLALPRALVVPTVVTAGEESEEIATVTDQSFDSRAVAVVRSDELGDVQPDPAGGGGDVRVIRDANSEVVLQASLTRASLVLLDDAWAPGWSVKIDGKPARALQTNVVLRGVVVPTGRHEIVWHYRVPGLRAGALLSLIGILACAVWGAVLVRRRSLRRAS